MKICIINGPNLNWLGKREVKIYGEKTLEDLETEWLAWGEKNNIEITCFQSNSEGDIIDYLYASDADGIVINPGALTHYSYSLRDCLSAIDKVIVEVHISNIAKREEFRQKSVISPVAKGTIAGLGVKGYILALESYLNA